MANLIYNSMVSREIITCGIFLFDKNDNMLIGHPTNSNNVIHKFWSIPKGWNEEGEDFFTSAKRELVEETNIDLDIIASNITMIYELPIHTFRGYNPFIKGPGNKRIASFIIITDRDFSQDDIRCDSMVTHMGPPFPEIDDYKWVTIEKAEKMLHSSQLTPLVEVKKVLENNV